MPNYFQTIADLLFPRQCVSCRKTLGPNDSHPETPLGNVLCESCFKGIVLNHTFFCGKCRARLPNGKKICHRDVPYILAAAADYGKNEAVRALIHNLKFNFLEAAAEPLGLLLAQYAAELNIFKEPRLIIPIPLSKQRRRERGFNQAELLARSLSKRFGAPLVTPLERLKNSPPQSGAQNAKARAVNVAGCFSVSDPAAVLGKRVVLVDDVTTSGATFLEAARALKNAGVKNILALAVAKA